MPTYIGLTALSGQIRPDELAVVAAALQTQVMRDFQPEWGVSAIVTACVIRRHPRRRDPADRARQPRPGGERTVTGPATTTAVYRRSPTARTGRWRRATNCCACWPIPPGRRGYPGRRDLTGRERWSICWMSADPARTWPRPTRSTAWRWPISAPRHSSAAAAAAFSFSRSVRQAWQPGANGVVTWLADDGLLYQARADATGRVRLHGGFSAASRGRMLLRELVDTLTPDRLEALSNAPPTPQTGRREAERAPGTAGAGDALPRGLAWRFGTPAPLPTVSRASAGSPPPGRPGSGAGGTTLRGMTRN